MGVRDAWLDKRLAAAGKNGLRNVSQMHLARQGVISEEMEFVARREKLEPELVRSEVASGRAIIHANVNDGSLGHGIGVAFRARSTPHRQLRGDWKSRRCWKTAPRGSLRSDTVMDLSTGGEIPRFAAPSSMPRLCPRTVLYEALPRHRCRTEVRSSCSRSSKSRPNRSGLHDHSC
jgi:phosphomethylpyrimidine synthase